MRPAILCALILAAQQPAERVGAFDHPSIVLADCRSGLLLRQVHEHKEAMEAAGRTGDRGRAAELDRWGRDSLRLAHRQLAGNAPTGNIWEALQPFLPGVAIRAGVSRVVLAPPPGVETVNVTPHLLDVLQADGSTWKIVDDLRRRDQRGGSVRR